MKQASNLLKTIQNCLSKNKFQRKVVKNICSDDFAKVTILWGDRGCGKTFCSLLCFLIDAMRNEKADKGPYSCVFLRVGVGALDTVIPEIRMIAGDFVKRFDKVRRVLEFWNGSTIKFLSVSGEYGIRRALKGQLVDFVVLDEADQFSEGVLMEIFSASRSSHKRGSKILLLSNPFRGDGWLKRMLKPYLSEDGKGVKNNDGKKFFVKPGADEYEFTECTQESDQTEGIVIQAFEGVFDDNEELKKQTSYEATVNFARAMARSHDIGIDESSWGALEDASCFDSKKITYISNDQAMNKLQNSLVTISCDLASGSKNSFAGQSGFIVIGYNGETEEGVIIDGFRGRLGLEECKAKIKEYRSKYNIQIFCCERTQLGITVLDYFNEKEKDLFKRVVATPPSSKIEKRISFFSQMLSAGNLFIWNGCPVGKKLEIELKRFCLDKKKEKKTNRSHDYSDDLIMAASHGFNVLKARYRNLSFSKETLVAEKKNFNLERLKLFDEKGTIEENSSTHLGIDLGKTFKFFTFPSSEVRRKMIFDHQEL